MPTAKVALSIPADAIRRAKKIVASGQAKSLRAFVAAALEEKLHADERAQILDEMDAKCGPPGRSGEHGLEKHVASCLTSITNSH